MICVAVTYVIKPGHEDEAITLFAKMTEHTRLNPAAGCTWHTARGPTRGGFFSTSSTTTKRRSMPIGRRPISSSTSRVDCS